MEQGFEGTTAFIAGGGTGIGRASALALAAAGCTVTVASAFAHPEHNLIELLQPIG